MNLTREQKAELNELSKYVFGSTSKWKKLMEKGQLTAVTEEVTEYVPNETDPDAEGTTRKVQVPVKVGNSPLSTVKRYSYEEVKEYLLTLKSKKDELMEKIRQHQEEQRKKQEQEALQKKVQEELGGSALA